VYHVVLFMTLSELYDATAHNENRNERFKEIANR
jgi:hypothetical protein